MEITAAREGIRDGRRARTALAGIGLAERAASGSLLRGAGGCGAAFEQLQMLEPNGGRDAANRPVLDALDASLRRVEPELAGNLGWTAKGINQCFIGMSAHGVIKRHV